MLGLIVIVLWATLAAPMGMDSAVPALVIALGGLAMAVGALLLLASWGRYDEAAAISPDLARLGGRAIVGASLAQGLAMLGFVILVLAVFFTR